jgi:hypothetical protein
MRRCQAPIAIRVISAYTLFALLFFPSLGQSHTLTGQDSTSLSQNYPNPFIVLTIIEYRVGSAAHITLKVLTIQGKQVMSLVDAEQAAGSYSVNLDGSLLHNGTYVYVLIDSSSTGVKKFTRKMVISGSTASVESANTVDEFVRLDQNYPNPFNGPTEITYSIPQPGRVTLRVFNMLGKEVVTMVDEDQGRNEYRVRFDGNGLPSGQYTYTLAYTASNIVSKVSRKMYLVK